MIPVEFAAYNIVPKRDGEIERVAHDREPMIFQDLGVQVFKRAPQFRSGGMVVLSTEGGVGIRLQCVAHAGAPGFIDMDEYEPMCVGDEHVVNELRDFGSGYGLLDVAHPKFSLYRATPSIILHILKKSFVSSLPLDYQQAPKRLFWSRFRDDHKSQYHEICHNQFFVSDYALTSE